MIFHNTEARQVYLHTANTTQVIALDEVPFSLYWGPTIHETHRPPKDENSSFEPLLSRERAEYPIWDGRTQSECCLRTDTAPRFLYDSLETEGQDTLRLFLIDPDTNHRITLVYHLYPDLDIIARHAELTAGTVPLPLDRAFSAAASLPWGAADFAQYYTTGSWAGEFQLRHRPVTEGVFTTQSYRNNSGHQFNPALALAAPGSTETQGDVYFAALAYTGGWKLSVEKTVFGNTRILGGLQDDDFGITLAPGATFTTPILYLGMTTAGLGGMSRTLHRFARGHILPTPALRRVLYNSWEATAFTVTAAGQKLLADRAAAMGVELFVIDDGWFGQRHTDEAGLGDWYVNPDKFPNGLDDLIGYVRGLGMDFGIWVEPECVNPDSDLYRAHPDWIYRLPNHEPIQLRHQYLLNLGLPEVKAFVLDMLRGLLRGHDIAYIKWDMNRTFTDIIERATHSGVREGHIAALYEIWATIRREFPHVELEACSGGGGRVDFGILPYADQYWPSDNTDPFERLFIQRGYSLFYPPKAMMCWVTDTPENHGKMARAGLAYKFHSAMCGGLGIGSDIGRLSDAQVAEYAGFIAQYKDVRETVQCGELYRLSPPEAQVCALCYVNGSKSEAVVFAFLHSQLYGVPQTPLRLAGLDSDALYRRMDTQEVFHGDTLMHLGLVLDLHGDFDSEMIRLERI